MSNTTQQLKAQQRREQFADLLREMFQLNQPELDFGLYRIMHARKDDINRFIDKDLPKITQQAFSQFASQDKSALEQELEAARKAAQAAGFDPEQSPKVQQIQAQLKDNFDLAREEGEVYDALITFFNRYYDEGDFLSRRVYKNGTYAIPYEGEEVVLHWANKDQYYIKSSETLRDYSFRLNPKASVGESPLRVHFKLVDAEAGAKDNNKEGDDNKRVFVLDTEQPFELAEGEAGEGGETYPELTLRFFFRASTSADWIASVKERATAAAQKKAPTQDHLRVIAVEHLLGEQSELPEEWKTPLAQKYRKADGELADYSMLQGQLNNYTKRNTFDYFIHKDLGGFLTRELDFYIKNELLDWDDIASLKNDTARLAPLLSKIEVIRTLAEKIIAFLAQLENFQKKLWLKKKFVTETNYCITVDRLAEHTDLLEQVFENEAQCHAWEELYKIDREKFEEDYEHLEWEEFLAKPEYRYLMLDTCYFDESFKARLLSKIEDLDEQCEGVLINSENFQAISFVETKYNSSAQCLYIDPPYNTDASPIIYKNGFRSSTWAAMAFDRVALGSKLLKQSGIICATIDDYQFRELSWIIESIFGEDSILGTATIRNNPAGRSTKKGFAISHEYGIFARKSSEVTLGRLEHTEKQKERYKEIDDNGRFEWVNFRKHGGANANRSARPKLFYPIFIKGEQIRVPPLEWNDSKRQWIALESKGENEIEVYPIAEDGSEKTWKWEHAALTGNISEFSVRKDRLGNASVYLKARINEEGTLPLTIWADSKYSASDYGTNLLKSMFPGEQAFSFPKSVHAVEDSITVSSGQDKNAFVVDFFAGSGTTGHAVINLNRRDGGKRKFCMVEMGEYFREVTLARMKKVVYCEKWKDGKPVTDGSKEKEAYTPSVLKYFQLESYEDCLGNLALHRSEGQQQLLESSDSSPLNEARQSYVLNYMLDVETRESPSLLNTRQFLDPTKYQLKVRSASGDETKPVNVDLLETFNYLLGLTVEHIAAPIYFEAEHSQGEFGRWQAKVKRSESGQWWFRTVFGTNRNGQKVLVVWRNLPSVIEGKANGMQMDNAVLDAVLIEKLAIRLTESPDDEIDILYVNGDHNIAIPRNRQGEPMEQARIQLIEEAFHRLMFADTDSVH